MSRGGGSDNINDRLWAANLSNYHYQGTNAFYRRTLCPHLNVVKLEKLVSSVSSPQSLYSRRLPFSSPASHPCPSACPGLQSLWASQERGLCGEKVNERLLNAYVSWNVDEVIFWLFRFPVLSYSVDPIIELACLTNGPVPNSDNCYHLIESWPPLTFYYLWLFFITD